MFIDQVEIVENIIDTVFKYCFFTSTKPHLSFILQHKGVSLEMLDRSKYESHM